MSFVTREELYRWCSVKAGDLEGHPEMKTLFRMVADRDEMGALMARELVDIIKANNAAGKATRAIIPCGPSCWYEPWTKLVNAEGVSLGDFHVFHMDECLDWQGRLLAKGHPYNFRTFMEEHFYGGIEEGLGVPEGQRWWLEPGTMEAVREEIWREPVDVTFGGWGQDGHIAYNQARRHPFSHVTVDEVAESTIRIQENNIDTVIALAQRTFGMAYQFVPPMSVTLGVKECLSAKKVRVYSDTGAWKQTALRVALFSEPVAEYPLTLLQNHADALITATVETAAHPIAEHPEWELF